MSLLRVESHFLWLAMIVVTVLTGWAFSPRIIATGFCQGAWITGDTRFYRRRDSLWGGSRQFFSRPFFRHPAAFTKPILFKVQLLAEFFSRAILDLSRGDGRAIAHAWLDFKVQHTVLTSIDIRRSVGGKSEHHRTAGWLTARRSDPTE